jgi:hypothetical protein
MLNMAVVPLNMAKQKIVLDKPKGVCIMSNMKTKKHPWAKMGVFKNRKEFHACRVCGNDTSAYGEICNACCAEPEQDLRPFLREKTASNTRNMQKLHERARL